MTSKYLYLTIDLVSFIFPFAASFYKKAPFYKQWKYLGISLAIIAGLFIIWDEIFTRLGVWGFREQYITGLHIGSLPLEEVLFFFCIPYACVFTYFALQHLIEKDVLFPHHELISSVLIITLLISAIYNIEKIYTAITFISLALFLAFQMLKLRPRYMGRFYLAYAVLLIPFLIVNSILTGSFIDNEVVWYNDQHNLGIRLGTIPIEDFFYSMLLMLLTISLMEWLEERAYYKNK
ncbi:MAG: lycopene cyclase domain-containing protein [Chryseolinea sp.]